MVKKQCCGSGPFFRIRIRGSGLKNPDPDPVDQKRPGPDPVDQKRPDPTGSGSGFYLDMFLMFSKINIFLWHFYTKSSQDI